MTVERQSRNKQETMRDVGFKIVEGVAAAITLLYIASAIYITSQRDFDALGPELANGLKMTAITGIIYAADRLTKGERKS
jgi:hypothetical protein